jgi:hypothetical protein
LTSPPNHLYSSWIGDKKFFRKFLNSQIFFIENNGIMCKICNTYYNKQQNHINKTKLIPFIDIESHPQNNSALKNHTNSEKHKKACMLLNKKVCCVKKKKKKLKLLKYNNNINNYIELSPSEIFFENQKKQKKNKFYKKFIKFCEI